MVTRKTRVLSAFAALLMLVSLFTCFVLPATAAATKVLTKDHLDTTYPNVPVEWPGDLVVFKYHADYPDATNWAITDAEDWRALITASASDTFAGESFWLTEDIDFENKVMAPVGSSKAFDANLYGQGHAMKNINVEATATKINACIGLIGNAQGTSQRVTRDLGLESGTITAWAKVEAAKTTDREFFVGAFAALTKARTFLNCWTNVDIIADEHPDTDLNGYADIAVFGRANSGLNNAVINCVNTGELSANTVGSGSRAFGTMMWAKGNVYVYNSLNFGVLRAVGAKGMLQTGDSKQEPDGWANNLTYSSVTVNVRDVSTSTTTPKYPGIISTPRPAGEIAYEMNAGYVAPSATTFPDADRGYYSVKKVDGKDVIYITTDASKQPVKLTFTMNGAELERYVVPENGKVDLNAAFGRTNATFKVDDEAVENGILTVAAASEVAGTVNLPENTPVAWPAEWVGEGASIVPYKDRVRPAEGEAEETTNFAITDAEDWFLAVLDCNKAEGAYNLQGSNVYNTMDGITLWLTNNIDFGAINIEAYAVSKAMTITQAFVMGYRANKDASFKGTVNGQNYAFENFILDVTYAVSNGNYDNFAVFGGIYDATIRDLTLDASCSFNYKVTIDVTSDCSSTSGTESFFGALVAVAVEGTNSIINCRNFADVTIEDLNDGTLISQHVNEEKNRDWTGQPVGNQVQSMSVFGRHSYTANIVNCYNAGTLTNMDGGRVVLVEWMNRSNANNIYNCANFGTFTSIGENPFPVGLIAASGTAGTAGTYKNNYSVGYPVGSTNIIDSGDLYGAELEAGAEMTGELAFLLNKNYAEYEGVEQKYYTIKNGTTVWGTAAEQPAKVVFDFGGDLTAKYAVPGDAAELATLFPLPGNAVYTMNGEPVTAITVEPCGEYLVKVSTDVKFYDFLQDKLDWFKTEVVEYFTNAEGDVLTQDLLDAMQQKVTADGYADQAAIDADYAILKGYAFNGETIVSIKDYHDYDSLNYSVSSKEEMEYLVTLKDKMTTKHTIYITNDINMGGSKENLNENLRGFKASINGGNHTISNLWVNTSWLGDFKGAFVKDLTIENSGYIHTTSDMAMLIETVTQDVILSNITLDNVEGFAPELYYSEAVDEETQEPFDKDTGGMQGMLVSSQDAGALTLKDITIINSTMHRPNKKGDDNAYWNSGLVLGKTYTGSINAEGIYLNNNTITGDRTNIGQGIAFGELINNATVKDIVVLNTTVESGDDTVLGVLSSMAKWGTVSGKSKSIGGVTCYKPHVADPVVTFENVIAYNNTEASNLVRSSKTFPITLKVTNAYTDTTKIFSEEYEAGTVTNYWDGSSEEAYSGEPYEGTVATNVYVEATDAIKSGEAAHALNTVEGSKKLAMDAEPIWDTEETEATVEVTLEMYVDGELYNTYKKYTDKDGKVMADEALKNLADWNADLDAVYSVDTVVTGTHVHAYDDGEVLQNPSCEGKGTMLYNCVCGFSYTDDIPEEGHDKVYAPAENQQHVVTCTKCDTYTETLDCIPDEDGWVETVAPSVDTFGEKKTTCTLCGGTVTEQVAKLTAAMVTAGINEEETEVTATVALLNNPGLDSVTVKVAFDYTVMDLKEVVAENGLTVGTPTVEEGVVTFTVTGEINHDITVAVATFTMKTEQDGSLAASNRDYELKVTADEMEGSKDIFTVTKGKDIVKGDMTGDKVVDLSDAILLIRYVSGTDLPEGYAGTITDAMADLTDEGDGADLGDGSFAPDVNVNDVLYLLRYLNGWTNVL